MGENSSLKRSWGFVLKGHYWVPNLTCSILTLQTFCFLCLSSSTFRPLHVLSWPSKMWSLPVVQFLAFLPAITLTKPWNLSALLRYLRSCLQLELEFWEDRFGKRSLWLGKAWEKYMKFICRVVFMPGAVMLLWLEIEANSFRHIGSRHILRSA